MKAAKNRGQSARRALEGESDWSLARNPAVAELLDHLAEELAREYVRLMEKAAQTEGARDPEPEQEEG